MKTHYYILLIVTSWILYSCHSDDNSYPIELWDFQLEVVDKDGNNLVEGIPTRTDPTTKAVFIKEDIYDWEVVFKGKVLSEKMKRLTLVEPDLNRLNISITNGEYEKKQEVVYKLSLSYVFGTEEEQIFTATWEKIKGAAKGEQVCTKILFNGEILPLSSENDIYVARLVLK